ncbi:hypothetical protein NKG94_32015 [Micromonospora sp. M12]
MRRGQRRRPAALHPESGETAVPVDDRITVVLCGRRLEAADRRIVEAFAAQAAIALRQERLADEAATARPSPRRNGCAPRCSPRSATTCVRRWRQRRRP